MLVHVDGAQAASQQQHCEVRHGVGVTVSRVMRARAPSAIRARVTASCVYVSSCRTVSERPAHSTRQRCTLYTELPYDIQLYTRDRGTGGARASGHGARQSAEINPDRYADARRRNDL